MTGFGGTCLHLSARKAASERQKAKSKKSIQWEMRGPSDHSFQQAKVDASVCLLWWTPVLQQYAVGGVSASSETTENPALLHNTTHVSLCPMDAASGFKGELTKSVPTISKDQVTLDWRLSSPFYLSSTVLFTLAPSTPHRSVVWAELLLPSKQMRDRLLSSLGCHQTDTWLLHCGTHCWVCAQMPRGGISRGLGGTGASEASQAPGDWGKCYRGWGDNRNSV